MRNLLIISMALLGCCAASPQRSLDRDSDKSALIIRFDNTNHDGSGNYKYSYETSNGIAAEEEGILKNKGTNNEIQTVRGSYQYPGPERQLYRIVYTADENGFQAQGDHLPTPPPIPPEIQKSLDIIYSNVRNQPGVAREPLQLRPRTQGFTLPRN